MTSPENVQLAANFGTFMFVAGALGLFTGTTLGRSGIIRRDEKPGEFYTTTICHIVLGAFCYVGQFFAQTG